ncbi:MAG: efflux RND transporter periplasmic adaptor subunit [Myxococcota bacterium]
MTSLLWAFVLIACEADVSETPPPLAVQAELVTVEALSNEILVTAVLEAEAWQPLYFQQSGVVARIDVTEGDTVKRGQRLASLDLAYQDNQVALARVAVRTAELEVAQATDDLTAARRVAESGGYSPEQVRDKEDRLKEAELALERQQLSLRSQRIKRDQMMLHAPFDGLISEMNLRVGDKVRSDVSDPDNDTNARPPMAAFQPGRFTARIALPERQSHRIQVGNAAQLSLVEDASVRFVGTVDWVAPSVDRDSRTVAVRARVALGPEVRGYDRVRDGSTVRLAVQASSDDGRVPTVPEGALVYHRDEAYVFVTDGQTAQRVAVTQGRVRDGRVEITAGLGQGVRVITTQVYRLTDGQSVRLVGEQGS